MDEGEREWFNSRPPGPPGLTEKYEEAKRKWKRAMNAVTEAKKGERLPPMKFGQGEDAVRLSSRFKAQQEMEAAKLREKLAEELLQEQAQKEAQLLEQKRQQLAQEQAEKERAAAEEKARQEEEERKRAAKAAHEKKSAQPSLMPLLNSTGFKGMSGATPMEILEKMTVIA
ncbi:Cald1p [Cichlidogyrus casuarinus]|uniref:Cald1p n=1 Tax=Cichlidogyrus casuarinus TaxID=1844966 RepID=A0ABD2QPJ9_9PLAT